MSSATAVIIGGGVIGLSTAYHLARRKFGKIVLLDKGCIGDGSSSRAAGIITGLLWSETGVQARKVSLRLFRELSEELEGYTFQDVGCLNLFDPVSFEERKQLLPLYDRLHASYEVVDSTEINRRFPALHVSDKVIGLFDPLGGYSEPHEYIPALTRRIRGMGVEIREYQKVLDIVVTNGRVTGVTTAEGTIHADAVISTVHAWTLLVVERIGLRFPIKTFIHQRYVTRPLPSPVNIPVVNANPLGGYVRPAASNRLLVGIETAEREEYRVASLDFRMSSLSADPELKVKAMRNFVTLVPDLERTSVEMESIGLIAFSIDGEPVLGPVKHLPGFYMAAAFHSGGFAYNPVTGQLLAEFVADGQSRIDVSAFSPDRFDARDVATHLATTIQQRDAVRRRH